MLEAKLKKPVGAVVLVTDTSLTSSTLIVM